ncbi:UNVERIFIED_CONTAM: hypothetical protein NCL1_49814 [Trichonephila clavipes]
MLLNNSWKNCVVRKAFTGRTKLLIIPCTHIFESNPRHSQQVPIPISPYGCISLTALYALASPSSINLIYRTPCKLSERWKFSMATETSILPPFPN